MSILTTLYGARKPSSMPCFSESWAFGRPEPLPDVAEPTAFLTFSMESALNPSSASLPFPRFMSSWTVSFILSI